MQIEFYTKNKTVQENFAPKPAKKVLPEWFKNLDQETQDFDSVPTIKFCVPVTDMMTSGYILFNSYESDIIQTKTYLNNVESDIAFASAMNPLLGDGLHISMHHKQQCPVKPEGVSTDFFKIHNEWVIKTPPGYSCLFIQPHYFFEKRYKLLPAIVDTDKHDLPVGLTGYLTDYENTLTLKPGDPIMQVIPFKRDIWKMEIVDAPETNSVFNFFMKRDNKPTKWYKKLFHTKKKFD